MTKFQKDIEVTLTHRGGSFTRTYFDHAKADSEYRALMNAWCSHLKTSLPLTHEIASDTGNTTRTTIRLDHVALVMFRTDDEEHFQNNLDDAEYSKKYLDRFNEELERRTSKAVGFK